MAVLETDLPVAAASQMEAGTACKTPRNRLLDLMAGWSRYVDSDEEDGFNDTPGLNDGIHDLYQEAGALDFNGNEPTGEAAEEAIRAFVIGRVLPVLLQK